jgi:hypothetical protein
MPPELELAAPERAPDEIGRASTYGRPHKDSAHQALLACAPSTQIDPTMFVCAHRSHRCGTVLLVESVNTGRVTACRVMDRGPYGALVGDHWQKKIRPSDPGTWRGVLDMAPAVRAALGPGDGGLLAVRIWIAYVPPRPIRVRPPSS